MADDVQTDIEEKPDVVPKAEYDAAIQELQGWKEQIGDAYKLTAAEVRQVLDSVSQELQAKKPEKTEEVKPKGKLSPAQKEEARAFLEEVFPGLSTLPEVVKALEGKTSTLAERSSAEDRRKAEKLIAELAVSEGYVGDPKKEAGFLKRLYHMVGNEVGDDPKLMAAYLKGDVDVVQSAFDAVKKDLEPKVVKVKKESPRFPALLARHAGLSPSTVVPEGPTPDQLAKMTPRERKKSVHDRAWAVMKNITEANEAERQMYGG